MGRRSTPGEDGTRVVLQGLPFAQLPHAALSLSDNAYHALGAIIREAGRRSWAEITDQEIGTALGPAGKSEASVQRALRELEQAHIIERRRRYGRRKIVLLYTLASREAQADPTPRRLANLTSACITDDGCTQRGGRMQSARLTGHSSNKRTIHTTAADAFGGVLDQIIAEGETSLNLLTGGSILDAPDEPDDEEKPAEGASLAEDPRPAGADHPCRDDSTRKEVRSQGKLVSKKHNPH